MSPDVITSLYIPLSSDLSISSSGINDEILKAVRGIDAKLIFVMEDVKVHMRPTTSQVSSGRSKRFKEKLMRNYNIKCEGGLMCMVTGWKVPPKTIVAGHLFPLRLKVRDRKYRH
jgi:hypothetical protein